MPNYIVLVDPDEDAVNGKWFDMDELVSGVDRPRRDMPAKFAGATYKPTPFIDVRKSDGAVAQVWMRA